MAKDFTIKVYKQLLNGLVSNGYSFQTYREFTEHPEEKVILLRHDVDARKEHSLQFAKIQHEVALRGRTISGWCRSPSMKG